MWGDGDFKMTSVDKEASFINGKIGQVQRRGLGKLMDDNVIKGD